MCVNQDALGAFVYASNAKSERCTLNVDTPNVTFTQNKQMDADFDLSFSVYDLKHHVNNL